MGLYPLLPVILTITLWSKVGWECVTDPRSANRFTWQKGISTQASQFVVWCSKHYIAWAFMGWLLLNSSKQPVLDKSFRLLQTWGFFQVCREICLVSSWFQSLDWSISHIWTHWELELWCCFVLLFCQILLFH